MMCSDESELGVKALGAVVWYLQRCLIDFKLLTMGRFSVYEPIDIESSIRVKDEKIVDSFNKHMVSLLYVLRIYKLVNINVMNRCRC